MGKSFNVGTQTPPPNERQAVDRSKDQIIGSTPKATITPVPNTHLLYIDIFKLVSVQLQPDGIAMPYAIDVSF